MICKEKNILFHSLSKIKTLLATERSSNMDTGEFCTHGIMISAVKFIGTKQSSCAITISDIDANSKDLGS